ncbi:MAG: hypothetical protein P4M13_03435 [Alphaproteobacteria bacterium]|nr:hypothetical protein [Alphaproteobacteria bacterium]
MHDNDDGGANGILQVGALLLCGITIVFAFRGCEKNVDQRKKLIEAMIKDGKGKIECKIDGNEYTFACKELTGKSPFRSLVLEANKRDQCLVLEGPK